MTSNLRTSFRNHDMAADERERRGVVLQPLVLVLDNVRSAYNVGSILRTAETAGVRKVVMCGLTPTPPHEKLAKTAFSAQVKFREHIRLLRDSRIERRYRQLQVEPRIRFNKVR